MLKEEAVPIGIIDTRSVKRIGIEENPVEAVLTEPGTDVLPEPFLFAASLLKCTTRFLNKAAAT